MKQVFLAAALLAPLAAQAQQPPPETAALGQEVMECVGGKIQLRTKIVQLEAELAKAKAAPVEPSKP